MVTLHHRELWVVARRDAFVTKHATDLEHALHATNDQAFEVQLESDAQKQLHIESVVVGDERASVGTAGFHVQHWRFHFDELIVVQCLSETGDCCVTDLECATRLFVDDEVGVTLAITRIDVGEAVPFVGHWAHGLCQQLRGVDFDRQLAFACCHH